jgi:hypothetical protein
MLALEQLLQAQDIPFDAEDNHIMCFPHIINICATHVIESFTDTQLVDEHVEFTASLPPRDADEQSYEDACAHDPIALCRHTVHAIHASGQRCDLFDEIIQDSNEKGWFRTPGNPCSTMEVPNLQLLHDVKTWWDSVYHMI